MKRSEEISIPTMKPTPCKEEEVVIEDKLKRPRKRNKNYMQDVDSDHNDSEGISFLLIHSYIDTCITVNIIHSEVVSTKTRKVNRAVVH